MLENRTAIVYGGGGALGGAIASAFAREGAVVHLAGRTAGKLDAVAERIAEAGGRARTAVVDALDEAAVERHADAVLAEAGSIDVSVNTVGVDNGDQGVPLVDLSPAQFTAPIEAYTRTAFLTSRAAARRMTGRGGVILTVSVPMARTPTALAGCFGAAFAAVENFTRQLAAEVGPHGVRVVGLRPTGMPGTVALGSHTAQVWGRAAERLGLPLDQLLEAVAAGSPLQRALTVEDVAETAVFVASARAGGLTSTVVNVSGGAISD